MIQRLYFIVFMLILFGSARAQVAYNLRDTLTKRPIIGENSVWHFFSEDEGHLQNGDLSDRFKELVQQAGFEDIRFPGGTVSDLIDWKKTIPSFDQREQQLTHIWRNYPNTPVGEVDPGGPEFGINEAIALSQVTGGELVLVFSPNYNIQHHLDMLEYITAEPNEDIDGDGVFWGQLRDNAGLPPAKVSTVEIGNELYSTNHFMWYMVPDNGANQIRNEPGTENRKDLAENGGSRTLTNALAHKGKGSPVKGNMYAATFHTEGLSNEVYYPFYPPVANISQIKVGQNHTDTSQYEVYTSIGVFGDNDDPLDPSFWMNAGANDRVYIYRESDGMVVFGDGVHGKIPVVGQNVYMDYISGPHDGYQEFYSRLKAIDPNLVVCDGVELPTANKDAMAIHGGWILKQAEENGPLLDDNIVTEMVSKGYFYYEKHIANKIEDFINKGWLKSGDKIIIGENSTLDHGPGSARFPIVDGNGVSHKNRKYSILGSITHLLQCERMTMLYGTHTANPVAVFNKTSMNLQAESIRTENATSSDPNLLYASSLAVSQEFFIKHTGKYALVKTVDNMPSITMKYRNPNNTNIVKTDGEIPEIVTYASRDESGDYIYLTAINHSDGSSPKSVTFDLQNAPSSTFDFANVQVTELVSDSIYAENSVANPNRIRIDTLSTNNDLILDNTNSKITFDVKPLSAKTVRINTGGILIGTVVQPPSGNIKIRNKSLNGLLQWTTLPDPSNVTREEVRMVADTVFNDQTTWQFVASDEPDWYYIESSNGTRLQLSDVPDSLAGKDGLALRLTSGTSTGPWVKWVLMDAGNNQVHLLNRAFDNYVRSTATNQDMNIPAYAVHGVSTISNGANTKWTLSDPVEIPTSWTYIDNLHHNTQGRMRYESVMDSNGFYDFSTVPTEWDGNHAQWVFIPVGDGAHYYVDNRQNPLVRLQGIDALETIDGLQGKETRLAPNNFNGDLVQWKVVDRGDGSVFLKNKGTGYYMSATDNNFGSNSQKWEVYSIPGDPNSSKTYWKFDSTTLGSRLVESLEVLNTTDVKQGLIVYPNSVKRGHSLSISYDESDLDEFQFRVFDIQGKSYSLNQFQDGGSVILDTHTLEEGIYILEIITKGSREQTKLIVN